jgi:hypothetical protein
MCTAVGKGVAASPLILVLASGVWTCDSAPPKPGSPSVPPAQNAPAGKAPETTPILKPESTIPLPIDTGSAGDSKDQFSPELERWLARMADGPDTMVTLQAWLAEHPSDNVSRATPTGLYAETFCRTASAVVTAGSRVWRRSAVFLIPPPFPGESLPDTTDVAGPLCRLRAFWLEGSDRDSLAAYRATWVLHRGLRRILGEGRPGVYMTGSGLAHWRGGVSWIRDQRVVVLGADPGGTYYSEAENADTTPVVELPTAVAVSYVIGNDLDIGVSALVDKMVFPKVDPEAVVAMSRADSALEWAGVPGLLPLRKLFAVHLDSAHFRPGEERPPPDPSMDSVLMHALGALRDTMILPPARRAAAFLAADIALHVHARWLDYKGQDTLRRVEFERAGARYDYDQLGAVHIYVRPWLWRAYQTDSLGPAGRSALAELLRAGWSTTVGCGAGPDVTGEIIRRGEGALNTGVQDPLVHMFVAQAYADVFSLAPNGVPDSASDSLRARTERSETGRLRAIAHYRAALNGVRDPGLRRRIWDQTVHLMLRLPIGTRYLCEYD